METNRVVLGLLLTLFSGLCTGIGGLFVLVWKKTNTKLLSLVLGFSAGVMIYVSFVEILGESRKYLIKSLGEKQGQWVSVLAFFGGIFLIALIDKLVPSYENPHESHKIEEIGVCKVEGNRNLLRTGVFTAIAIGIHNFPEGMASFTSAVMNPSLGIAIAIAIAIHNIPEGIAVSIPAYCATGSKRKAFGLSLVSGLAEPIGALVGYLILLPFLSDTVFGVLFGIVSGIMVYISLDELLPTAEKYGEHHLSIFGLITGMIVMAISLLLFM